MMTTTEDIKINKNIPFNLLESYKKKVVPADEALKAIKSNDNVLVQCGCAVPLRLIDALVARKEELTNVTMMHVLTVGDLPYLKPGMENHLKRRSTTEKNGTT